MMYVIGGVFVAVGLTMMLVVLLRRAKDIALLNVETIAEERERQMKNELTLRRFSRKKEMMKNMAEAFSAPVKNAVNKSLLALKDSATSLERRYREERRATQKGGTTDAVKVRSLLVELERLMREKMYAEAEKLCLEILSKDKRSKVAYSALADIYMETKQYPQAKETLEFLTKLSPTDPDVFSAYADTLLTLGEKPQALQALRKSCALRPNNNELRFHLAETLAGMEKYAEAAEEAQIIVDREPANPRYLDFLIETSILCGDAGSAKSALAQLRAANPENQKLPHWEEKIKHMPL